MKVFINYKRALNFLYEETDIHCSGWLFLQNVPEIRKINFFENIIGVSFLLVQPLELLAKFNGTLVLLSSSPECQRSVIQQDTSYLALQISPLFFFICRETNSVG